MIHDQWNSSTSKLDLKYKYRSLNSNNWSGGDIHNGGSAGNETFSVCKTHDGKLQLVYDFIVSGESPDEAIYHRSYDGHNWSDTFTLDDSWFGGQNGLTSVSNDFFVLWRPGEDAYLHYRQYDTIPLAPQNLAVQIHLEGGATYPKLTWSFNNEPDVFIKTSAYQVWRRHSISGGSWSNWSIIGYRDGDENQYIDYTISGLYAEANTAEYKLRVSDYTNHLSDYSSSVSINFSEFNKISSGYVLNEYGLEQNYPNPFNPTTTISYSIKSTGLVTLKVYDVMGTEVASLVNDNKEAGNYSVTFNASELPSGIYFYTVTSGNFKDTKKLILLK